MRNIIILILAAACFSISIGVSYSIDSTVKHAYLELKITNNTDNLVDKAVITFGTNRCYFGLLGVRSSATYLGWIKQVTPNVVIQWTDIKQNNKETTLSLTNIYNLNTEGRLVFLINTTNVTVDFEKLTRAKK